MRPVCLPRKSGKIVPGGMPVQQRFASGTPKGDSRVRHKPVKICFSRENSDTFTFRSCHFLQGDMNLASYPCLIIWDWLPKIIAVFLLTGRLN